MSLSSYQIIWLCSHKGNLNCNWYTFHSLYVLIVKSYDNLVPIVSELNRQIQAEDCSSLLWVNSLRGRTHTIAFVCTISAKSCGVVSLSNWQEESEYHHKSEYLAIITFKDVCCELTLARDELGPWTARRDAPQAMLLQPAAGGEINHTTNPLFFSQTMITWPREHHVPPPVSPYTPRCRCWVHEWVGWWV